MQNAIVVIGTTQNEMDDQAH